MAMRPPSPAASSPAIFKVARFLAGDSFSDFADLRAAGPFTGVRKTTPLPDLDGSLRAITHSRLAPALPSASKTRAKPPGLSSILELQTSTFVTVKLIKLLSFENQSRGRGQGDKSIRSGPGLANRADRRHSGDA